MAHDTEYYSSRLVTTKLVAGKKEERKEYQLITKSYTITVLVFLLQY